MTQTLPPDLPYPDHSSDASPRSVAFFETKSETSITMQSRQGTPDDGTTSRRDRLKNFAALMLVTVPPFIVGCERPPARGQAPSVESRSSAEPEVDRSYNLTINGYNYTDTGISSFEVNGQGGGNLEVSIPNAGGGKSTCCIAVHTPLTAPFPVTIKWSRDAENWCDQTVLLHPPLPANPKYFQVHFYQDGHVEIAVTDKVSPPRISLERDGPGNRHAIVNMNVNNDPRFSRCKRGYR